MYIYIYICIIHIYIYIYIYPVEKRAGEREGKKTIPAAAAKNYTRVKQKSCTCSKPTAP